jgi:hypothetical protein
MLILGRGSCSIVPHNRADLKVTLGWRALPVGRMQRNVIRWQRDAMRGPMRQVECRGRKHLGWVWGIARARHWAGRHGHVRPAVRRVWDQVRRRRAVVNRRRWDATVRAVFDPGSMPVRRTAQVTIVQMPLLAHAPGWRRGHCRADGRALISARSRRALRGLDLLPWLLVIGELRPRIAAILRMEVPVAIRRRSSIAHRQMARVAVASGTLVRHVKLGKERVRDPCAR